MVFCSHHDYHNIKRLFYLFDTFLKDDSDEPKLMYIWGHSYEFGRNNNWGRIERFCESACGRIIFGTRQISKYTIITLICTD